MKKYINGCLSKFLTSNQRKIGKKKVIFIPKWIKLYFYKKLEFFTNLFISINRKKENKEINFRSNFKIKIFLRKNLSPNKLN